MSASAGRIRTTLVAGPIEPTATPPGKLTGQQFIMPGAPIDLYFTHEVAQQWISTLQTIKKEDNA